MQVQKLIECKHLNSLRRSLVPVLMYRFLRKYALGDLQRQMIRDSIPGILVEIRQRLQNAYDTLARMGTLHQKTANKRQYYQDFASPICQIYMLR
jgi:hypothetical protein